MIPLDVAVQFIVVSIALALVPGPDNLFVLLQSAIGGSRRGVAVTLGLCTGLVVHTAAVALGVAAIFQASATAFTALKILGAAYLLYLAYGAFRAGGGTPAGGGTEGAAAERSGLALYGRGVLMNLTNPKVAIFFLAFLPQFVKADAGSVTFQIAQLGMLFILSALVVFCAIACAAGSLGGWLKRSPRAIPVMNKVAGCVFVGLAARLAMAER
ncbi:LysE family translocator [Thauera sinica]|uniref:LysE family translocator n=1 Tax=Thauera sinica TaxID=2665146 RepID=A0ABW1AVE2_9RHOO|nr:LysE family translocator [Thauera sp. K11]